MAKGKDNASVVGKAVLVSSALAIFLCLIAIIVGAVMISYTPDVETWKSCKSQANVTDAMCGSTSSSGSVSGGRRLAETGLSALKSKDTNELKMWARETFAAPKQHRRLFGAANTNACGFSGTVCAMKSTGESGGTITCKTGDTCTDDSSKKLTCQTGIAVDANCFEVVALKDTARTGFRKGDCCDSACGFGTLETAECSATADKYQEKCTCTFNMYTSDYGKCSSTKSAGWKTTPTLFGETKCKWSDSSGSSSTGTVCNPESCEDWVTCNMVAAFCAPEASIAATNAGYEILRMIIIVGSLVIIAGMLPICIGGTGKAMGNDDIGNICGGIGCCSAVFFTGCGGTIMIFIPFLVGAAISSVCVEIEKINADLHSTCGSEGLSACGDAMKNDVASLCAVGSGMFATSSIQIVAQVFGLLAVVLTMVGWCQHRKQPQAQMPVVQATTVVKA
jgi:hypothetical protein